MSHTEPILKRSATNRLKISNHSARKTSIDTLLNNDVHPLHVVQLSGHKNIESLNHYHVASKDQQRHMSDILNQETNFNISPPAMPSNRVTCTTENSTTAALSFQRPPFQNLRYNIIDDYSDDESK